MFCKYYAPVCIAAWKTGNTSERKLIEFVYLIVFFLNWKIKMKLKLQTECDYDNIFYLQQLSILQ